MESVELGSVEIRTFGSGIVTVKVALPSGCKMSLELLGVEKHGLPSGVYDTSLEEDALAKIAKTTVDAVTDILSKMNKRLSES